MSLTFACSSDCTISFVSEDIISISDMIGEFDTFSGKDSGTILAMDGLDEGEVFTHEEDNT